MYVVVLNFQNRMGFFTLLKKWLRLKKNVVYPLIYLLVSLTLTLLVVTTTVESAFLARKIVKNWLRSWMSDQWMNNSLIVYIEKDIFVTLIMKLSCNGFKIWKHVEINWKRLYELIFCYFSFFFFSFFIYMHNVYRLLTFFVLCLLKFEINWYIP